jgi:hypothetical protein
MNTVNIIIIRSTGIQQYKIPYSQGDVPQQVKQVQKPSTSEPTTKSSTHMKLLKPNS